MKKAVETRYFGWLAGAGLGLCLVAGAGTAMGQVTCTIENWTGAPTGLSNANAGTQGANNRRYAGPCGLRVPVDGTARFLTDPSPNGESSLNARFYAFLNNAGNQQIILYAANGGNPVADQIQVVYNLPAAGDLSLRVFDANAAPHQLTFQNIGSGWHSIEFAWQAGPTATIAFSVNGATDLTTTLNTNGITLDNSMLGNINGATGSGFIDFDDFDSRRDKRPSVEAPLLVGDANGDGGLTGADLTTVINELLGATFSAGQPDCNQDGVITGADFTCILNRILNP